MPGLTNDERVHVKKSWGREEWYVNKPEYCGKSLFFKKGKKCSFHVHEMKDEVLLVHSGKIKIWWSYTDKFPDGEEGSIILNKGDTFHVPPGMRHQMLALEDTEIIEFSTQHFDEDSIRITKGD